MKIKPIYLCLLAGTVSGASNFMIKKGTILDYLVGLVCIAAVVYAVYKHFKTS